MRTFEIYEIVQAITAIEIQVTIIRLMVWPKDDNTNGNKNSRK